MGRRSPNSDKIATHAEMRDLIASTPSDDPTWFAFGDTILAPDTVTDMLAQHLSQARRAAIEGALHKRTENVTVVLEGLVDYGNVSAVMRTAEGFGIQRVHAVDTADKYKRSKRTTQGADKWIDRYRWDAIGRCLDSLADDGYRIVAADVSGTARPIWDVDLTDRCAIVLGNELEGLTPETKRRADIAVTIPMVGFTESFNISVAASLVLYEVMAQRRSRFGSSGDLPAEVRSRIRAVWYSKSVSNARAVIEHKLASVNQ
jgi:tRNA (guanosine-2'-O-)-methyltransferase